LLNIYHFTYIFSYAHTEAHTHKHTCIISTQEATRHRSLAERGGRRAFVRDKGLAHTNKRKKEKGKKGFREKKMSGKPVIHEFEHKEIPAKLLDYFLQSNKSNINQIFQQLSQPNMNTGQINDGPKLDQRWINSGSRMHQSTIIYNVSPL